MHRSVNISVVGASPLVQHNPRLANPLDPITKEIKTISGKRKKTEDDYRRLADLEWRGGLYLNADGRVIVPGEIIEATLVKAAKATRFGEAFKAGIMVPDDPILQYEGPQDIEKLADDPNFRDMRNVTVDRKRIMRCRPIFRAWSLRFNTLYLPDVLDPKKVVEVVEHAGRLVGFMEMRPRYGRFLVESVDGVKLNAA